MDEKHIVAIDLGSYKVALTVARINGDDIQVIYYKEARSEGIRNSYVYNSMKVTRSLRALVEDAEKELNIKITQVVAGMPKYNVYQVTSQAKMPLNEEECITEDDINTLKTSALERYPLEKPEREVLFGAVAQSFSTGEDFQLVENDIIGIPSDVLEGNFKVFIGKKSALHALDVAFNNLKLGVAKKYFTPEVLAKAVLTPAEMDNGVALIDFGGGATSVSIYSGSIMRHYAAIPFGGMAVTTDIRNECMISDSLAETIKLAFGACMPDKLQTLSEKIIQINNASEAVPNKQLPVKYLSEIITYRVKEIMEAILYEIEQSGYADNLRSGIVLTGGSANLTNCANYIKELSGYDVRHGYPKHQLVSHMGCDAIRETNAAVSLGLVLAAKADRIPDCVLGETMVNIGDTVTFGENGTCKEEADAGETGDNIPVTEEAVTENEASAPDTDTRTGHAAENDGAGAKDPELFSKGEIEEVPVADGAKKGKGHKKRGENVIWTTIESTIDKVCRKLFEDNPGV